MGDTIGTQGMYTYAVDQGYDRRPWRAKDSSGWNTIQIETVEVIKFAKKLMGVESCMVNPKHTPLNFYVEPVAQNLFIKLLQEGKTNDEAFMEVFAMRPCPVYLRRGYNQILMHNRKS
jgi:hypothetical protein